MSSLKHSVAQLERSQKQVLHIVEHSLTVINTTRFEVAQNRDSINNLITSLITLKSAVNKQHNRHERQFLQLTGFHEVINNLQTMTAECRHLFTRGQIFITDLKLKFTALSAQKLAPSVISPDHLLQILREIRTQLPSGFIMPLNPDKDLWRLYSTLTCSTVLSDTHMALIIDIPLKPVDSAYTLIQASPIPIPFLNQSAPVKITTDSKAMAAAIQLESSYFLINDKHSHFAILNDLEAHDCLAQSLPFCEINKGFKSAYNSQSCLIASYLRERDTVKSLCTSYIHNTAIFPTAQSLSRSKWLIVTETAIHFTIKCINGTHSSFQITPPIQILQLPSACHAFSNTLFLPLFFDYTSSAGKLLDKFQFRPISVSNVSLSEIWAPFHTRLANFTAVKIPPKLAQVKSLPMQELIDQVQLLEAVQPIDDTTPFYKSQWFLSGGVVLIVCILAGFITLLIFRKSVKNCANGLKVRKLRKTSQLNSNFTPTTTPAKQKDINHQAVLMTTDPSAPQERVCLLYPSFRDNADSLRQETTPAVN